MNEIVVPICNASDAAWAAAQAIAMYRSAAGAHSPRERAAAAAEARRAVLQPQRPARFHQDTGMRVLESAIRMLDEAGVPHEDHVLVGHPAETIVRFAEDHGCRADHRRHAAAGMLSMFGSARSAARCGI